MQSETFWFHPQAIREIQQAFAWYDERGPEAATTFMAVLDATLDRLLTFPRSGTRISGGCRAAVVGKYPYLVVYQVEDSRIGIYAIAHTSRRSGYWRDRLEE